MITAGVDRVRWGALTGCSLARTWGTSGLGTVWPKSFISLSSRPWVGA